MAELRTLAFLTQLAPGHVRTGIRDRPRRGIPAFYPEGSRGRFTIRNHEGSPLTQSETAMPYRYRVPLLGPRLLLLLLGLIFLFPVPASATDYLNVLDPQNPWRARQGTIEEALISIRPTGLFIEYGVYLTFSAQGTDFRSNDLLEIEMMFDLPDEAVVTDLWLWVGDEIMRAQMYDQWTASNIYENIVNRQRDPAILFKRSATQYELRVYPMRGDESRRIKLTYLMPATWSSAQVSAPLPTDILQTSRKPLSSVSLVAWPGGTGIEGSAGEWSAPTLAEYPKHAFVAQKDQDQRSYLSSRLTSDMVDKTLTLTYASPMKDGVYVNHFEKNGEGIYQLAFLPSQALEVGEAQRVSVLVDYAASNSSIGSVEILEAVRQFLRNHLSDDDQFNVILSQLAVKRASESWLPADSATIEDLFADLGDNDLANYSNLPALLSNGVQFIQEQGEGGEILLVSNASQVGDFQEANRLIQDLTAEMDPTISVHVVDFQDQNLNAHHIGGVQYRGNEYFYVNLSRLTSGTYVNARDDGALPTMLAAVFDALSGLITSFDLYTTLESGFGFARFTSGSMYGSAGVTTPIRQVGKYMGSFPFRIEASGVHDGDAFRINISVDGSDVIPADSTNETIWVGKYIQFLESQPASNEVISEIIEYSMRQRVLSRYTAFLALEPSDSVAACGDCRDESQLVSSDDELPVDTLITIEAYPNPFSERTTVVAKLGSAAPEVEAAIYDVMGRRIRTFTGRTAGERWEFVWEGRDDAGREVANGVYFVVVKTAHQRISRKLVRMR